MYQNTSLTDADLVFSDAASGLLVFMVNADFKNVNMTSVQAIRVSLICSCYRHTLTRFRAQDNGGRGNILTPFNWVAPGPDPSWYGNGMWTYFSPCVTTNSTGGLVFTNTVFGSTRCNHMKTTGSPLGSVWAVSTNDAMETLPFGATGKVHR
jgi:hypothetical protein